MAGMETADRGINGGREARDWTRASILLPAIAALAVGYLHFNFIENHFATGAYRDAAWFSHLVFKNSILLENPKLVYSSYGWSFYSAHVSPVLFAFTLPSYVLQLDRITHLSLTFAIQSALLVMAAAAAVLALRLPLRPVLDGLLAAEEG